MDRFRLNPGALGEALGGTTGGGAERDRDGLGERDLEDGVDQSRLANAGPAGDYQHLGGESDATASRWLSASASFVRCSTQGIALSASIAGQGGLPTASALSFSAISRSARYKPARKTQRRPSRSSAITAPPSRSRPSAVSTSSAGTSSSV